MATRGSERTPVHFFLAEEALDPLRALDPDHDWTELQRGERAWVLQTYLRLRQSGYPVRLTSEPPPEGIVVFHTKQRQALAARLPAGRDLVLVGVRGDLKAPFIADFEVVQNRSSADDARTFYVPHWPQPGLLARDPERGTHVRRVAFKGFLRNLHPYFQRPEWRRLLADRGIEWVVDAVAFTEQHTPWDTLRWPDYRDVDVILAFRPRDRKTDRSKPATKLYNAWLARVPAILGPEMPFRELRRSPLDYIEIRHPEEAFGAIERLAAEPDLYRKMVENGAARSTEFSVAGVVARWRELLDVVLPARMATGHDRALRRMPLAVRTTVRRFRHAIAAPGRRLRARAPAAEP